MACKCGCNVSAMSEDFMVKLQELRTKCGFALPVTSGYRCAKHNEAINGHPNSAHQTGEGADLGVQQKGEGRFVHVDTKQRHTGKPNLWSYA